MIVYKDGNLFQAPEKVLAHGCNCRGAFGAGVAGLMARFHPKARSAYLYHHKTKGWKLGQVQYVSSNNKIIANCATQDRYGNGPKEKVVYADYKAIERSMMDLYSYCKKNNYSIAIPLIGAGLANGDWKIIESIINKTFYDYEIVVYLYKKQS